MSSEFAAIATPSHLGCCDNPLTLPCPNQPKPPASTAVSPLHPKHHRRRKARLPPGAGPFETSRRADELPVVTPEVEVIQRHRCSGGDPEGVGAVVGVVEGGQRVGRGPC